MANGQETAQPQQACQPPLFTAAGLLNPDHPLIRLGGAAIVAIIGLIVVTVGLSTVLGYNVMGSWAYWTALLAAGGFYLVAWLEKKSSFKAASAVFRAAIVGMLIFVALNAVWPGANVRTAAYRARHYGEAMYSKGLHPLGLSAGGFRQVSLEGKGSYDIVNSPDGGFVIVNENGMKIPSYDKNRWPQTGSFTVYALTDQKDLALVVN